HRRVRRRPGRCRRGRRARDGRAALDAGSVTPSRRADITTVDGLSVIRRAVRSTAPAGGGPGASPFDGVEDADATAGMTVLFVHGAMDRATSFGRVMRRLPQLDTVAVDRRGYGDS